MASSPSSFATGQTLQHRSSHPSFLSVKKAHLPTSRNNGQKGILETERIICLYSRIAIKGWGLGSLGKVLAAQA